MHLIILTFFLLLFLPNFNTTDTTIVNIFPACTSDTDCPSYKYSSCQASVCQSCTTTSSLCDHVTPGGTGLCSSNVCIVSCTTHADCKSMRAQCDITMDSSCRSCGDDSECIDGTGTYSSCDRTGTDPSGYTIGVCSNCAPGKSCAKGRCENYKCVECYSNSECPYTAPVCDIKYESNFCIGCSANSECTTPGNSVCSGSGSCARCSTSSDCSHIANYNACNPSTGCVECTQDSHCSAGKPYCNLATNKCEQKEETSDATQAVVKTIETTAKTMMGVSGSMMFAGANPALLWALISLLQAFYYLIFINVNYPENVEAFFALFNPLSTSDAVLISFFLRFYFSCFRTKEIRIHIQKNP